MGGSVNRSFRLADDGMQSKEKGRFQTSMNKMLLFIDYIVINHVLFMNPDVY